MGSPPNLTGSKKPSVPTSKGLLPMMAFLDTMPNASRGCGMEQQILGNLKGLGDAP